MPAVSINLYFIWKSPLISYSHWNQMKKVYFQQCKLAKGRRKAFFFAFRCSYYSHRSPENENIFIYSSSKNTSRIIQINESNKFQAHIWSNPHRVERFLQSTFPTKKLRPIHRITLSKFQITHTASYPQM